MAILRCYGLWGNVSTVFEKGRYSDINVNSSRYWKDLSLVGFLASYCIYTCTKNQSFRSLVVDYLLNLPRTIEDERRVVAFIIFDHRKEFSVNDVLSSLLRQVVQGSSQVSNSVMDWWKGSKHPLNIENLMHMLTGQIGSDRVDFAVDAFDEYPCRDQLLAHFRNLMEAGNVRILITTRPNLTPLIEDHDKRVDIARSDGEIRRFVEAQITQPTVPGNILKKLPALLSRAVEIYGEGFWHECVLQLVEKSGGR
jgi:hypothetical protein